MHDGHGAEADGGGGYHAWRARLLADQAASRTARAQQRPPTCGFGPGLAAALLHGGGR